MPRIVGIEIPDAKRIAVSLTYIYGVGRTSSERILAEAGISPDKRAKELTEDEINRLASIIEKDWVIEGQLRRQEAQNISRLRDIGCYRGLRHRRGLPVRGQRTRTNARTRPGKKTTVAGKKSVTSLRG
ncbi:MAG: 30S ribosomal protein S13 [Planctomycetota bacterium]